MAGEWLKFDSSTPDKPEVLAITVAMGWDDPDLTVGKLLRVWRWFDQQTIDGNAVGVTAALLDRLLGVSGLCAAMAKVGWLLITDDGLSLPNFDRHNGKTAKDRALTAKRVANHKANAQANAQGNGKGNDASVSGALPREEKSREEKKRNTKEKKCAEPQSDSPPVVLMPLVSGDEHPVTAEQAEEWQKSFPAVDVCQQLQQMRAWCNANPANRKTSRGVNSFIVGWLGRAQNSAPKVANHVQAHSGPQWWATAGFATAADANNAGCWQHNAAEFHNGKREVAA